MPVRKWGSEFLVNTETNGYQDHSAITALADGRFVVVWRDESGTPPDGAGLRGQVFNADGSKLGAEFPVNTTTTGRQEDPAVAALSDGRFVVAWSDVPLGETNVLAQIFNGDGSKAGSEIPAFVTSNDEATPTITELSGGGFAIAIAGAGPSGYEIQARIFDANGVPAGAGFALTTPTSDARYMPALTSLSDGRLLATWADEGQGSPDIVARIFQADGTPLTGQLPVNGTVRDLQIAPNATALADGRFVVTWTDIGIDFADIWAQLFDADGTPAGREFLVARTGDYAEFASAAAALTDGRFVVAWSDVNRTGEDTSGYAVRAQVFNPDGSRSGAEFQVNTGTLADQARPDIAVLADGRFVVSWNDASERPDDATGLAVRAQIFDPRESAIVLSGSALGDDFVGTEFDDVMNGGGGDDRLAGADGNDTLDGGAGDDIMAGGAGDDVYFYSGDAGDRLIEDILAGTDLVRSSVSFTLGANLENLTLTGEAAINGFGDALANVIIGNAAGNIIEGDGGDDVIDGGAGADVMRGGTGTTASRSTMRRMSWPSKAAREPTRSEARWPSGWGAASRT